jgi:hypothetical protein
MVRVVYVSGIVHPPSNRGSDYNGFYFRACEFEDAAKKLKGKPVYLDHRKDLGPIGTIHKMVYRKNGELAAHMFITDQTDAGKKAIEGLHSGIYGGLSIGQISNKDSLVTGICTKIDPYEVSICQTPGRDGSFIEKFGTGGVMYEVCPFYVSQFSNEPPQTNQDPRRHHKMDNSISRIADTATKDGVAVNASAAAAEYLQFLEESKLPSDYVIKSMKRFREDAIETRKAVVDDIFADIKGKIKVTREDLDSLGDIPLEILANALGNFKSSEEQRAAAEAANKAKLEQLERTNQELLTKLGEQSKAPALSSQNERYVPGPADQVATGELEVNASGGQRRVAGAVAIAPTPSIFEARFANKPISNPFGLDFGAMTKSVRTSGFARPQTTNPEHLA